MNRSRLNPREHDKTLTRVAWREGPFIVECTGTGAMRLCVYYARFVMAEEPVASLADAWTRGSEICRELGGLDFTAYGKEP